VKLIEVKNFEFVF